MKTPKSHAYALAAAWIREGCERLERDEAGFNSVFPDLKRVADALERAAIALDSSNTEASAK